MMIHQWLTYLLFLLILIYFLIVTNDIGVERYLFDVFVLAAVLLLL
jgi:hypothetical protein